MKKIILLLIAATVFLSGYTQNVKVAETAVITSATNTKDGNVICWEFTSNEPVDCVTMEVKARETGGVFKTTVGTDGKNCLAQFTTSANGCFTDTYKPSKNRTYRLRVIRSDWSSYYSNEVTAQ